MHVTKITTKNCEVFGAGGTISRGQFPIALLDKEKRMPDLPPLESVRAFEAAARHESFVRAAEELRVTSATVSHRVQALERHVGARLFSRYARGVRLNTRVRAYAEEIRHIFAGITAATERHRDRAEAKRLKLVAVEVVAEKWLMPRLADFKAVHPAKATE